jgi:hypothetical protein
LSAQILNLQIASMIGFISSSHDVIMSPKAGRANQVKSLEYRSNIPSKITRLRYSISFESDAFDADFIFELKVGLLPNTMWIKGCSRGAAVGVDSTYINTRVVVMPSRR